MAFNGVLFQFGSFVFPNKYIKADTFKARPNQRQNLNAYTDVDGVTHTNPLKHTKTQVSFSTIKMSAAAMDNITENIVGNYENYDDRNAHCVYYDDENRTYKTGEFYLDQSLEFSKELTKDGTKIRRYNEMVWTFIEK